VQLACTAPISAIPARSHSCPEGFDWPRGTRGAQGGADGFTDRRRGFPDCGDALSASTSPRTRHARFSLASISFLWQFLVEYAYRPLSPVDRFVDRSFR
jgi:hypothetical protein